jgi:hypothetical protein
MSSQPLDIAALADALSPPESNAAPNERWCPTGSHWLPEASFTTLPGGKLSRDCKRCEARRREVAEQRKHQERAESLPMTGVDIDAIHLKWKRRTA